MAFLFANCALCQQGRGIKLRVVPQPGQVLVTYVNDVPMCKEHAEAHIAHSKAHCSNCKDCQMCGVRDCPYRNPLHYLCPALDLCTGLSDSDSSSEEETESSEEL